VPIWITSGTEAPAPVPWCPDTVAIHHGADDNASGSAGLLAIARSLAADSASLQRSVVVIFFSGEELGTLGSGFYVLHPFFPLSATTAMINMDMVGRMENNTLHGQWHRNIHRLGLAPHAGEHQTRR